MVDGEGWFATCFPARSLRPRACPPPHTLCRHAVRLPRCFLVHNILSPPPRRPFTNARLRLQFAKICDGSNSLYAALLEGALGGGVLGALCDLAPAAFSDLPTCCMVATAGQGMLGGAAGDATAALLPAWLKAAFAFSDPPGGPSPSSFDYLWVRRARAGGGGGRREGTVQLLPAGRSRALHRWWLAACGSEQRRLCYPAAAVIPHWLPAQRAGGVRGHHGMRGPPLTELRELPGPA